VWDAIRGDRDAESIEAIWPHGLNLQPRVVGLDPKPPQGQSWHQSLLLKFVEDSAVGKQFAGHVDPRRPTRRP